MSFRRFREKKEALAIATVTNIVHEAYDRNKEALDRLALDITMQSYFKDNKE